MHKILLFLTFLFFLFKGSSQVNASYKWTWIGGDNTINSYGIYGQKGVESVSNKPGGRGYFFSWTDFKGNFWLFGGQGMAARGQGNLNDLWRYNVSTNRWTWMAGDSLPNRPAIQSGLGVEAAANTPSARESGTFWSSSDGKELYLFGGYSPSIAWQFYNDVWAYNVVTEKWRQVKARMVDSRGNCTGQAYGGADEFTPGVWPICRLGATAASDAGKAFVFGGSNGTVNGTFNDFLMFSDYNQYFPQSNQWASIVSPLGTPIISPSGQYSGSYPYPGGRDIPNSFVYNNQFYLFGGAGYGALVNNVSNRGFLNDVWRYEGRDLLSKRAIWKWLGGDTTINGNGNYGTQGVSTTTNKPRARGHAMMKHAGGSQFILFGGESAAGNLNDLWSYDASSNTWTWLSGSPNPNIIGNYGTKGVQSGGNMIGGRTGTAMWITANGEIYLFGGSTPYGKRNDMWKFSPQQVPTPANDEPCTAIPLVLDAAPAYGNNSFATTSAIDGAVTCFSYSNTVWYKYTPDISGLVQFTLGGGQPGDTLNSWASIFVPSGTCPSLSLIDSTNSLFGGCKTYNALGRKSATVWTSYLTAGKTYYLRISSLFNDVGQYSISMQSTRQILPAQPNITRIASREETDVLGWTHYYNDNGTPASTNDDIKLLSILKNGNDIGSVGDGSFSLTLATTTKAGTGRGEIITSPLLPAGTKFVSMNRYWNVTPTNQPTTPVTIRFYYNTQDLADVNGDLVPSTVHFLLRPFKLSGGNPDPAANWAGASGVRFYQESTSTDGNGWTYDALGNNTHMAEFTVSSFSGGGIGGTNNFALPVSLLSFNVTNENDKVRLNWSTATETNSKAFEIQRSLDGRNFQTIGSIAAAGNSSSLRNYSYDDKEALQFAGTTLYYRLVLADMDGQQRFTEIKSIRLENLRNILTLQVNPLQSEVVVNYVSTIAGTLHIRIIDVTGRSVLAEQVSVKNGTNQIKLQTAGLAKGIYAITVYSNDRNSVTKQFQKL